LAGLAAIAAIGVFTPRAVAADAGIVAALVNPVLAAIPAPAGWQERSICFGNEQVDKAWCLYFAWPL
jgi:hypothetical protein